MNNRETEVARWLALRRAGLGSTNFAVLLARFGSVGESWAAPLEALQAAGVTTQYARAVVRARERFDPDAELAAVEKAGARVYTWMDEDYPSSLRTIEQAPPVLFARGNATLELEPALAVVGTRRVTAYGRQATEQFVEAVARQGVAIVSGLARGVDAIAHRLALESGTRTVGVLAGGIDQVYPRENAGLADRIMEHGALVSEYPPGTPARADYFPRRNRILSGLAGATLVVEAGEGSGALHTANWAFAQGRDVFAIPGSVFSKQSQGTNQLIRESTAKLVATPEQLCEELNLLAATQQMPLAAPEPPALRETATQEAPPVAVEVPPAEGPDGALLAALSSEPRHVDELARELQLPIQHVSGRLQMLELRGLVAEVRTLTFAKR